MKLGLYELDQIYTGDARELAKAIPDESVDLIFTDPPYPREFLPLYDWLAQTAARILRPGGSCMALSGQYYFPDVFASMMRHLDYHWINCMYMPSVASIGTIWPRSISVRWKPVLWFTRGNSNHKFVSDGISSRVTDKRFHNWGQGIDWAWYWIQELTDEYSIIMDPFVGGGTVPAVCKMLGRHYLAFEIDPDTAERARQRVQNTQPPLFVPQPEQAEMFVE